MHPAADHAVTGGSLALRDLSFVVGKDVVGAAGVDVELIAQQRHRHRRALNVPAWEPGAPRARPDLQPVFAGRLPEREIARMMLAWIDLAARSGQPRGRRVSGQPGLSREARDVVVHHAADLVGMT